MNARKIKYTDFELALHQKTLLLTTVISHRDLARCCWPSSPIAPPYWQFFKMRSTQLLESSRPLLESSRPLSLNQVAPLHCRPELVLFTFRLLLHTKHHVTIGDLMMAKQKQGESISEYILRWRNLSVRCTPPLLEQHAVELLLTNIKGPIASLLERFTVHSFEKLLSKASSLQAEISEVSTLQKNQVSAINKGKKPIQMQPEQLKKKKKKSDQASSSATNTLPFTPSFEMRRNKKYPFKKEVVRKIFKELLKYPSFKLPEPKYPEKIGDKKKSNYCLYHRQLGHTIENCFTFKDWLERGYKQGIISIPREYLDSDSGSVDLTAGIEEASVAGFED